MHFVLQSRLRVALSRLSQRLLADFPDRHLERSSALYGLSLQLGCQDLLSPFVLLRGTIHDDTTATNQSREADLQTGRGSRYVYGSGSVSVCLCGKWCPGGRNHLPGRYCLSFEGLRDPKLYKLDLSYILLSTLHCLYTYSTLSFCVSLTMSPPTKKTLFVFDQIRTRSHLLFRYFSTSPQLDPIPHPFLEAASAGPDRWFYDPNIAENGKDVLQNYLPIMSSKTHAPSAEYFANKVAAAHEKVN